MNGGNNSMCPVCARSFNVPYNRFKCKTYSDERKHL